MVIDLGLDREPPAARLRDWGRRPGHWRPVALALVAVLLLAVTGSGPAPAPSLTLTASFGLDRRTDFVVIGDRLYVSVPSAGPSTDQRWLLSAYELPGGRPLWTAPYESSVEQFVDVQPAAGLVLVTGLVGGEGIATPTTAVEAATGRVLWTLPTRVAVSDDGRTGVIGGLLRPGEPAGASVRAVDLTTGRDLWKATFAAPTSVRPVPDGRAVTVTNGDDGGHAEVRDVRTGAVLASRTVLPTGAGATLSVTVGDTLLLGYQDTAGDRGVAAYATDTLELRWRRVITEDDVRRFSPCGPLVCTPSAFGVEAIDPDTGKLVWHTDEADAVFDVGGVLVADAQPAGLAAVDPATGRTLFDLGGLETVLSPRTEHGLVSVGRTIGDDRSWLSIARPHTAAPRPLGVVPYRVWDCVAGERSVVCRAPDDKLSIWTYR
ncbi:PQQ-binding-like beta-propeller repeat protein [Phytohabitans sp. ZYX-F-186]|uniref:PQQ-binding-like beta-propeller repeat protein n=1 Tax=Phytohabitans maris TaxID=3071409 RepID=A0ABU0ZJH5_9ACTN|nr:PQQ-binding-like beta-propeller repeat protein [Phytohabitans sp. ZYX-F-186]MDQ7906527.1 PQQ-binding-like beta-propeller repeat protein [Phytohabitans sp. ZYX-F-186]